MTRSTTYQSVEELLKLLVKLKSEEAYNVFLDWLWKTNQHHIYNLLTVNDYQFNTDHVNRIHQNFASLLDNINVTYKLLAYLGQDGVLSSSDIESIKTAIFNDGPTKATDKLLTLMMRTSTEQYNNFLSGLQNDDQGHVVDILSKTVTERQLPFPVQEVAATHNQAENKGRSPQKKIFNLESILEKVEGEIMKKFHSEQSSQIDETDNYNEIENHAVPGIQEDILKLVKLLHQTILEDREEILRLRANNSSSNELGLTSYNESVVSKFRTELEVMMKNQRPINKYRAKKLQINKGPFVFGNVQNMLVGKSNKMNTHALESTVQQRISGQQYLQLSGSGQLPICLPQTQCDNPALLTNDSATQAQLDKLAEIKIGRSIQAPIRNLDQSQIISQSPPSSGKSIGSGNACSFQEQHDSIDGVVQPKIVIPAQPGVDSSAQSEFNSLVKRDIGSLVQPDVDSSVDPDEDGTPV